MIFFLILLLTSLSAFSAPTSSRLIPLFTKAIETYQQDGPYSAGIKAMHRLFSEHDFDQDWLQRFSRLDRRSWPLPAPLPVAKGGELPELALQVARFEVREATDDWLGDDIYCYFFVTDGSLPWGKVTSIYRGVRGGESFFFNPTDRRLFPLQGEMGVPRGQLVVDYGIMESDGDDGKKTRRLMGLVIDLALAAYGELEPGPGQVMLSLRAEIKALAEALGSLDHDDRMATGTVVLDATTVRRRLKGGIRAEWSTTHHSGSFWNKWSYRLGWRLFRR